MDNENYVGHFSQIYGVEEHRLAEGKGEGMRLFEVKNGKGLEFTVSADRCSDISRLSLHGVNMGYFAPCGYVAPTYYDKEEFEFLKSFTCGFLTTCGLTTIGSPSTDNGEKFPLHGNISNTPAEHIYYRYGIDGISVHATIRDAAIFRNKLVLERTISCRTDSNKLRINDTVKNEGSEKIPIMLLYHVNIGYPLLDENSELYIPSKEVEPRDARAKEGITEWSRMAKPQAGFVEQCYYHKFKDKNGVAMIFNKKVNRGMSIKFDTSQFGSFVQWKMMGEKDYVLGLEPCTGKIEGRKAARENGELKFITPGEEQSFTTEFEFFDSKADWDAAK